MKSCFSPTAVRAQGKAWQIRVLLAQWLKEAGPEAKLTDLIDSRLPVIQLHRFRLIESGGELCVVPSDNLRTWPKWSS